MSVCYYHNSIWKCLSKLRSCFDVQCSINDKMVKFQLSFISVWYVLNILPGSLIQWHPEADLDNPMVLMCICPPLAVIGLGFPPNRSYILLENHPVYKYELYNKSMICNLYSVICTHFSYVWIVHFFIIARYTT